MWKAEQGQTVDGVLSADPVALSYLLEGTGPVGVPGGTKLSAANAVDLLLSEVYRTQPDAELQNVFFAAAARAVFDAVASGKGDPAALLEGLTRSANEGRVFAWSAEPREQQLLAETVARRRRPERGGFLAVRRGLPERRHGREDAVLPRASRRRGAGLLQLGRAAGARGHRDDDVERSEERRRSASVGDRAA